MPNPHDTQYIPIPTQEEIIDFQNEDTEKPQLDSDGSCFGFSNAFLYTHFTHFSSDAFAKRLNATVPNIPLIRLFDQSNNTRETIIERLKTNNVHGAFLYIEDENANDANKLYFITKQGQLMEALNPAISHVEFENNYLACIVSHNNHDENETYSYQKLTINEIKYLLHLQTLHSDTEQKLYDAFTSDEASSSFINTVAWLHDGEKNAENQLELAEDLHTARNYAKITNNTNAITSFATHNNHKQNIEKILPLLPGESTYQIYITYEYHDNKNKASPSIESHAVSIKKDADNYYHYYDPNNPFIIKTTSAGIVLDDLIKQYNNNQKSIIFINMNISKIPDLFNTQKDVVAHENIEHTHQLQNNCWSPEAMQNYLDYLLYNGNIYLSQKAIQSINEQDQAERKAAFIKIALYNNEALLHWFINTYPNDVYLPAKYLLNTYEADCFSVLIKKNVFKIEEIDQTGSTLYHYAMQTKAPYVIHEIFSTYPITIEKLTQKNQAGQTPLKLLAEAGPACLNALLETNQGKTLLTENPDIFIHHVMRDAKTHSDRANILKIFFEYEINPCSTFHYTWELSTSILNFAYSQNDWQSIGAVLAATAGTQHYITWVEDALNHKSDYQALIKLPILLTFIMHIEDQEKKIALLTLALAKGANPNLKVAHGLLPLKYAYIQGDKEAQQLLLVKGAALNHKENNNLSRSGFFSNSSPTPTENRVCDISVKP